LGNFASAKMLTGSHALRPNFFQKSTDHSIEYKKCLQGSPLRNFTSAKMLAGTTGSRAARPVTDSLSNLLITVTHTLLGHIVTSFENVTNSLHESTQDGAVSDSVGGGDMAAAAATKPGGGEAEMIGWLVFGCSFINSVMGLVGDIKV